MKKIKLGRTEVLYRDSIEEITVARDIVFHRALLSDSNPGGDLSKVLLKNRAVGKLIKVGKREEAIKEVANIEATILNALSGINYKMLAFAALVYEIDGKPVQVENIDDAIEIHERLKGLASVKSIWDFVREAKKKWTLKKHLRSQVA